MAGYLRTLLVDHSRFDGTRLATEADVPNKLLKGFRLRPTDSGISMYKLNEVNADSIERAVTAHALGHPISIAALGYRVVDEAALEFVAAKIEASDGGTPDDDVNTWHYEVKRPSDEEIRTITFQFYKNGYGTQVDMAHLEAQIVVAYTDGRFRLDRLSSGVHERVVTILLEQGVALA